METVTRHSRFAKLHPTLLQGMLFGSEHSADFPIEGEEADYNRIGRVYPGPSVLIVDAITYSTADMFASGYQCHGIGKVIGVDENIGAGGANNWKYSHLRSLLPHGDAQFPALPPGIDFSFAARQAIRRGPYAGMILEDEGVKLEVSYKLTKRDLLEGSKDLMAFACNLLAS
jgi:hypothetical protein